VTRVFDDFSSPPSNSYITSNVQFQITGVSQHDSSQRAAAVSWNAAGANVFFQSNAASTVDLSSYKTLDIRLTRQCGDPECRNPGPQFHTTTNFSIQLITGNNGDKSGSIQAQGYVSLTGPVGSLVEFSGATPHPMFLTARIPLSAFAGANLSSVTGVRFTFDDTNTDQIFIANIRASKISGGGNSSSAAAQPLPSDDTPLQTDSTPDQNTVQNLKSVSASSAIDGTAGVEIRLTSNRNFLPTGQLLTLQIGSQQFNISRFADDGSTNQVIFTLTQDEFSSLQQGDPVAVQYGDSGLGRTWNFGHLDKTILNQ
jgi:hypothetical protein